MNSDRDLDLLQRYVDGQASADDMRELNARLGGEPTLRRQLMELLNLDSALAAVSQDVEAELAERPLGTNAPEQPQKFSVPPASSSTSQTLPIDNTPPPGPAPPPDGACASARAAGGGVAIMFLALAACLMAVVGAGVWWQSSNADWATVQKRVGENGLLEGMRLRGQTHQVDAGLVHLVTARGAEVVIEAPAEFRFESAERLKMLRGRLSADVPSAAQGFTVITPSGNAVDLGTRFGVDVPISGASEIHVFEGQVIAEATGEPTSTSLRQGDALSMDGGRSAARGFRSSAFIQTDEISELTAALERGQRRNSDAALAALRRDPALITLLDFETDDLPPGVFRMAQGRWPGSRAPEFVNVGDHMRLNVGEGRQWNQLTLAAWVRLDRLGEPYQSLLHTDGWDSSNPGQVHWMLNRNTTMRLALFGNLLADGSEEKEWYPDSRTPVLPERGRWVHLATVYDATAGTVRFYLNGQFDKQTEQALAHPAKLGPAQIGNWNRNDRKLSGRIDELLILGRAMEDKEIEQLFLAGNPYR
ncbi:LamG-like jellyroll fold domain-containing protein [Roseimaritima ulvae]|uniref:FecR protein n=1 Tax=Roseimaritima ulvae TaxID=980254 RepID=A0A5B9QU91_9BACT|nr:LamG-like jellyroll fold domain-containing protein [Roseimaritima ulvae]QEG40975.1 FecR protein [Roseimaritima ulvae]